VEVRGHLDGLEVHHPLYGFVSCTQCGFRLGCREPLQLMSRKQFVVCQTHPLMVHSHVRHIMFNTVWNCSVSSGLAEAGPCGRNV
jgi:hypothetical protein